MARLAQSRTQNEIAFAYQTLAEHLATFCEIRVIPFDGPAVDLYFELRAARVRVGAMDLKIAAIAMANDATLLSRNVADFHRVPGLRVEDWSA